MMHSEIGASLIIGDATSEAFAWAESHLTMKNPEYAKKERMGLWLGSTPKEIRLYSVSGPNLILPFGVLEEAWKALGLWKRHYELDFAPWRAISLKGGQSLYPYQEKAVEAMMKAKCGVLVAPCGSGKTQMGLTLIHRLGGRALWLTNTQKLLKQSEERAKKLFPGIRCGEVTEGKCEFGGDVTFATVQTMSRLDPASYRNEFSVVVCDECQHAVGSPTQVRMFYRVVGNCACRHKYGLTATPKRQDGLTPAMHALLGPTAHEVTEAEVGARIVKAKHIRVDYDREYSPWLYCSTDGTVDFAAMTSAICSDGARNALIASKVAERFAEGGRRQLVLTSRVDHAKALAETIPGASLCVGSVPESRRDYGAPVIVATYALAKEGLDIPDLDAVHFATPIKDPIAVRQSAGRVERAKEGKMPPVVYDYVDESIPYCVRAYRKRRAILK